MPSERISYRPDRVGQPRVELLYEAEVGARAFRSLPFVVGVLGDFSGNRAEPLAELKDPKFIQIDRDNFDQVMGRMKPGLNLRVENTLQGDGTEMAVQLRFDSLSDFEPARIVNQVEPLRRLMETRNKLRDVPPSTSRPARGSDPLEQILQNMARPGAAKVPAEAVEPPRPKDQLTTLIDAALRGTATWSTDELRQAAARIDEVDAAISKQLAAVLHHKEFQRLDAAWRGLHYLVHRTETDAQLSIQVLNISRRELFADQKVYPGEWSGPGGQPCSVLIADLEFTADPEDMALLGQLAGVAAAAYCPLIATASAERFDQKDSAWQAFRATEESRFVALVVPRVLARLPYGPNTKSASEEEDLPFREVRLDAKGRDLALSHDHYTWMNPAFILAVRLTDAFARHGWWMHLLGRDGLQVDDLPAHVYFDEDGDAGLKGPTQTDLDGGRQAETLRDLGFLLLYHPRNATQVFFGTATTHAPAGMASQLPCVLAYARVAHYLRTLAEQWLFGDKASDLEAQLNRWLEGYVNPEPLADLDRRALAPFLSAHVQVTPEAGRPARWRLVGTLRLRLWGQRDDRTDAPEFRFDMPMPA